jgi:hypothetical protein|nr:hypothetical protein [uncultured Nocardioides sp.]
MQATLTDIDPFDLPEWLGTGDVVWRADEGLQTGHLVRGRLAADQPDHPAGASQEIVCDLLAVDEAYPEPVVDDATRLRVHQAWRHGQVVIGEHGSRMVLAVPGTRFGPELVLDALGRLARAVGARAERYAVLLRLG